MSADVQARRSFLEQYRTVRHAEGRGSADSAYYRALPYLDLSGKSQGMWTMRACTYRYFETRLLSRWERQAARPLHVLDLGAGNCWMSYRLALRDHQVTAVDIFNDELDGLGAARQYPVSIPAVEAEFDALPFRPNRFDLLIYNASVHYSTDYAQTLREALDCLRPSGRIVILDSPIYRRPEHGARMVDERKRAYEQKYGFPSDAMHSVEYLDEWTIQFLGEELGIHWETYKPWYGWQWHLRPIKALIQRKRPPSRFWILVGSLNRP